MGWDDLCHDLKGMIIRNLSFKEFGTLLNVNWEWFGLALQYMKFEGIGHEDTDVRRIFRYLFCLWDFKYEHARRNITRFLRNESICPMDFILGLSGYHSRSDDCALNDIYDIIFKRRIIDIITDDDIDIILVEQQRMIHDCIENEYDDDDFSIIATLDRIELVSKFNRQSLQNLQ